MFHLHFQLKESRLEPDLCYIHTITTSSGVYIHSDWQLRK